MASTWLSSSRAERTQVPERLPYIWTADGWCYLAILVDLCTRSIVGWAVSDHCDTDLALRALEAACARHQPAPGPLHHTDRGSTYSATDYRARLHQLGMQQSMSRKGNCWDNAVSESTIGTMKAELFGDRVPGSIDEVRSLLFPYIEGFYNRHRLHSSINYLTPADKENLTRHAMAVA